MSDTTKTDRARLPEPVPTSDRRVLALARLLGIVDRLRAPDGCPWDRKQTLTSMAPYLVEEAHEALEAIERGDDAHSAEEAGDLLMVVALVCRIAEEAGRFDLARAANGIADKLVRRHPHVFGEVKADTAEAALASWEAIKKGERASEKKDDSALAGVPVSLPALQRAHRMCGKAVSAGFRWAGVEGAIAKLDEERAELGVELARSGLGRDAKASSTPEQRAAVEHELGDVLLAAAFLASYLDMDPERLCREALRRFEGRFRGMETGLSNPMKDHSLDELLAAWRKAKESSA